MARHDGEFRASADEPLSLEELIALFGNASATESRRRQDAIACYLSGGEGWREAVQRLGGAFAEAEAELRERKAD